VLFFVVLLNKLIFKYIIINNKSVLIEYLNKIIKTIKNKINNMTLANKTFRNNKTGETIRVLDNFGDTVVLENKTKIDKSVLLDTSKYSEQIDPSSFLDTSSAFSSVLNDIKNLKTDDMIDENVSFDRDDSFKPSSNESAIIQSSEEEERAALAKKYGAEVDVSDSVNKQNEAMNRIINGDDTPSENPSNARKSQDISYDTKQTSETRETTTRQSNAEPIQQTQRIDEDPIIAMFKNVKKNVPFTFDLEIDRKIPRLDFIEMMEDSYNVSIIDFLAEEFTRELLHNPSLVKDRIKREIEIKVYGESESDKKESKPKAKSSKKPSASDRVKSISKLETVEEIDVALKGETAKTVKEAGKKRISELKK